MKRISKLSINLIFGILIGLGAANFLMILSDTIIRYLMSLNHNYNYFLLKSISMLIYWGTFGIILWASMRIKVNRLSKYLIMSMVTAIAGAIAAGVIMLKLFYLTNDTEKIQMLVTKENGFLIVVGYIALFFFSLLFVFNLIYTRLINRKVKYLLYISNEVKRMEEEGVGLKIEEQGSDELTQLCQGINSMSAKLLAELEYEKKLEKEKNELITNVSHDLRTPLTSVIGYIQLLKQNGFEDKEKFDEYMEVVERRVNGLKGMIDELFEYTKLISTEQVLTSMEVDMVPLLEHLMNEYQYIYQKTDLQLEKKIQVTTCKCSIDPDKIIRVLQNLFDNARKYAKPQSCIQVNVYEENEWFVFEIQNDILNNHKIDLDRLFDRFYVADEARTRQDSSGLGLSIVKRIIELHQGELNVTLENDKIQFQIRLTKHNSSGKLSKNRE